MSEIAQTRLRAAVIAITPVVALIGASYHPYIGDLADNAATVRAVDRNTDRTGDGGG